MIAALTISRTAALVTLGVLAWLGLAWLGLAVCLALAIGLSIRDADRRAEKQRRAVAADAAAAAAEDAGLELVVDDVEPPTIPLPAVEADLLADEPIEVLSDAEIAARFRQIVQPEFTTETWL